MHSFIYMLSRGKNDFQGRGGGRKMIFRENKHPSIKLRWQVLHSWFPKTINFEQLLRGIYFQEIAQSPWTSKGKFFPILMPHKNACISRIRRFFLNQVFKTYYQRYFHPTLIFDKKLLFPRRVLISKLRNL